MPDEQADGRLPGDARLDRVLEAIVGGKDRERARAYIEGLCGDRSRKTVRSIAGSSQPKGRVQLQRFLTDVARDCSILCDQLALEANDLVGGDRACLVVDDIVLPKKGTASVGVARRVDSATGKRANFQALVSLSLASEGKTIPVAIRLVLPRAWIDDPAKRLAAGIPEALSAADDQAAYETDWIVVREIGRLRDLGVRFGVVVAPVHCGTEYFREKLAEWETGWVLPISERDEFYQRENKSTSQGKRHNVKFKAEAERAFDIIHRDSGRQMRRCDWSGKYEPVIAKFQDVSRTKPQRDRHGAMTSPGRVWIWMQSNGRNQSSWWMSNLPPNTAEVRLVDSIRNLWLVREMIERVKGEFGLTAYQGRSWVGLHRHALMVCLAALRECKC
ncbi:IS701 family transposase [Methylobacterium longum]|uniref:IS701 family transposase n=1 Tax=Methylobacterium longum TaxID=767694 RepID=A0ABT8AK99_9HYPH|nr:IS701 family transposase [Methylobacterium longum]MDN3569981.1 IS701 family transposase [Methylobacterium longum]GJE12767.1 IS701 family transposase ISMpo9 [Methylobacterium longum]